MDQLETVSAAGALRGTQRCIQAGAVSSRRYLWKRLP
jgi:hypothetical protein